MSSDLFAIGYGLLAGLVIIALLGLLIRVVGIVRYIPNNRIGVVEKLWSGSGSVQAGLLAMNGEAEDVTRALKDLAE